MDKKIGIRLRKLREQNNLTKREFADIIGISYSCVNDWERGQREPRLKYLIKIALFFKVKTDYLLGFIDKFGNKIN